MNGGGDDLKLNLLLYICMYYKVRTDDHPPNDSGDKQLWDEIGVAHRQADINITDITIRQETEETGKTENDEENQTETLKYTSTRDDAPMITPTDVTEDTTDRRGRLTTDSPTVNPLLNNQTTRYYLYTTSLTAYRNY
jgi:hypothetical protein